MFSIVMLVMIYRNRSEPENGLAWKLVGYLLLGGFTFSLNDIRLPLGFVVYWLYFRKPKPNWIIKHKAALMGLLLYVAQLIIPEIASALERR